VDTTVGECWMSTVDEKPNLPPESRKHPQPKRRPLESTATLCESPMEAVAGLGLRV
jgi:hypothetical protein